MITTLIIEANHIFLFTSFFLGLLLGSFLNVCISRLPRGISVIAPRSYCPACTAPIRWYDNIPVISWLLLRRRCRDCNREIPWRYPLVELAMGVWLFQLAVSAEMLGCCGEQSSFVPRLVNYGLGEIAVAILGFLLIGLIVIDWQTQLLPDAFTLSGIAIGLFLVCTQAIFLGPNEDQVLLSNHHIHLTSPGAATDPGNVFLTGPERLIGGRLAAIAGAALLLLIVRWLYKAVRHRDGMGLGDVKMLAMIAAFLGFWPAILSLFLGLMAASLYAILLLATGRATRLTRLPFGSFLGIGGLVAALAGDRIIESYARLLQ